MVTAIPEAAGRQAGSRLTWVRLAVIAFDTVSYVTMMRGTGPIPQKVVAVILLAWGYGLALLWAERQQRLPRLFATPLTSGLDALFIFLWISLTGGFASPFYVMIYASVVVVGTRYSPAATVLIAALYAGAYVAIAQASTGIGSHLGELSTRVVFIFVNSALGSIIASNKSTLAFARRHEQAMQRSLTLLAEAQRLARMGSWEWDIRTDKMVWSDELYRILGREPGSLATLQSYHEAVHPDDAASVRRVLAAAIQARKSFFFDHRMIRPSGELRWLSCRGHFVQDGAALPERVFGTAQDTTEKKQMEERLHLSDRLVSLGALAGGVAHEINNPLMYVTGNLDFTARKLKALPANVQPLVAGLDEALNEARHGAERVRRIVLDLKGFSRPDEDELGPVDLTRIVELAVNMTWNQIRHRAQFRKDVERAPKVIGNESRLGQVLVNLLMNAAQAIEEGAPERNEISVRAYQIPDGRVALEVADSGAGIAPEVRARVFEPFFTTKPVGTGTGLGLAICHSIIASLRGEIELVPQSGRGATFRILLHRAAAQLATPTHPLSLVTPTPVRKSRVLVVDDDPLILASLERMLRPEHDVVLADGGMAALEYIRSGSRFELILCDIMMPGMNGTEVHSVLSAMAPDQVGALVFMTGGAFTPEAQAFLQNVKNDRLHKPLERQQIRALVQARLAGAARD